MNLPIGSGDRPVLLQQVPTVAFRNKMHLYLAPINILLSSARTCQGCKRPLLEQQQQQQPHLEIRDFRSVAGLLSSSTSRLIDNRMVIESPAIRENRYLARPEQDDHLLRYQSLVCRLCVVINRLWTSDTPLLLFLRSIVDSSRLLMWTPLLYYT